jgi:hypothetical protein
MKLKTICMLLFTVSCAYAMGQGEERDTAIVKSYNYISVFYNCVPLHPYKTLGTGRGYGVSIDGIIISAPINLSGLFEIYGNAAKGHYQNCTGIIFKDLHFGKDVFTAIQTIHPDSKEDTAIFSTPIFVCAKPLRAIDTLGVLRGSIFLKSFNSKLIRYFQKAKKRYPACDGIMIDNIDLVLGTYKIVVFRWKKSDKIIPSKK